MDTMSKKKQMLFSLKIPDNILHDEKHAKKFERSLEYISYLILKDKVSIFEECRMKVSCYINLKPSEEMENHIETPFNNLNLNNEITQEFFKISDIISINLDKLLGICLFGSKIKIYLDVRVMSMDKIVFSLATENEV